MHFIYFIYSWFSAQLLPTHKKGVWWGFLHLSKLQQGSITQDTFLHYVIPSPNWFKEILLEVQKSDVNSAKPSSITVPVVRSDCMHLNLNSDMDLDKGACAKRDGGCAENHKNNCTWHPKVNLHLHSAWMVLTGGNNFFAWKVWILKIERV